MTTVMVAAFEKWESEMHSSGVAALDELKVREIVKSDTKQAFSVIKFLLCCFGYLHQISGSKLFDIAAVRDSDIKRTSPESGDDLGNSNTIAFLNFCGDAFTTGASAKSLSVTDAAKKRKEKAVQPIVRLLEYAPKAIVLLYETSSTLDKSVTEKTSALEISSKNVADDIQKFISDRRLASIQLDEKRRLQELRKVSIITACCKLLVSYRFCYGKQGEKGHDAKAAQEISENSSPKSI